MSSLPTYDPSAALAVLGGDALLKNADALHAARDETMRDVDLLASGDVPAGKQPLDSGFIKWPEKLLAEYESGGDSSLVGRVQTVGTRLKEETDRVVSLGIGGSYMGLRAIFEALYSPHHNQRSRSARREVPCLSFGGFNMDNDQTWSLLDLLKDCYTNPDEVTGRWSIVVISKSGGTLETAAAFRIFRQAAEAYYGEGSDALKQYVVPVTGASGKLHDLSTQAGYADEFAIPDGIGGRFSVLTAVGLLPAAALGVDVVAMLRGAKDMTDCFANGTVGDCPVLDYVGVCHAAEADHGMTIRLLSTWGDRLEAFGFWYDQLLSESLGKEEKGATPITGVQTRDLHSRGQQHQEGRRDKLITNLFVKEPVAPEVTLPKVDDDRDLDQLNRFAGKSMQTLLTAAFEGTNKAYADDRRPTADLTVERLDAYSLGALFQFFMLATACEGRLIGVNPYGQPGVEAYKKNMVEILSR